MPDPVILTPRPGAGLPAYGKAAIALLRPSGGPRLAGIVPTIPSNPNSSPGYLYSLAEIATASSAVRAGAVVCLGDSITRYGSWDEVSPFAFNAGISGEKIEGLLNRVAGLDCLQRAAAVHLHIGINNINNDEDQTTIKSRMAALMNYLSGPLVVTKVIYQATTTQKADTDDFNAYVVAMAAARGNCAVVDLNTVVAPAGTILGPYTTDGLHLSPAAYAAWYPLVRSALGSLGL